MGQRCSKRDWSVVTTCSTPILGGDRVYAIVVMPGCTPTKEAVRAVSRIATYNHIVAKQLMEDVPSTIFAAHATKVLARKNALVKAGTPIEVHPDFPYDEDGKLIDEVKLNGLLLRAFSELTDKFEEYASWQDGTETGCFLTYEDPPPLTQKALDERDESFLSRLGSFTQRLMTSGNDYSVKEVSAGPI